MVSFGADLDLEQPRSPLRLFDLMPDESHMAIFAAALKAEYVGPIREYFNDPRTAWGYVDPQLRLFLMNQEEYAVMLHGLELTQEEVNRRIEARFPSDRPILWSEGDDPPTLLGTAEGLAAYIQHRGNYQVTTDHQHDDFVVTNMTTGRRYLVSRAYWHHIHTNANTYTERVRLGEAIQNAINPRPDETNPPSPQPYLDADPIPQYVQGGNAIHQFTTIAQMLTPELMQQAADAIRNER